MKVVLLHDWVMSLRGGEKVLEAFCELFPDASLYTLVHTPNSTTPTIEGRNITTSFLQKVPGIQKHYRKFLPFFPMAADGLKIKERPDLVLSSSHCVIKGVKTPSGAKHISYIHSPMRYIYDQYESYFGQGAPFYQRIGAKLTRGHLTQWDKNSNKNVDHFIANSSFVKGRIDQYYGVPSEVIHPFVDLKDFRSIQNSLPQKEDYYLMVTAFAPNKRVDLAIETFNQSGLPLKIVGSGQKERELKAQAKGNIQFLGNASRDEVIDLMARAQAFIFPGVEDFGITPLESMAAGTPIIAFKKGGVLETLNDKVATFFDSPSAESLQGAINRFEQSAFLKKDLLQRAELFSKEKFKSNIMNFIEKKLG